MTIYRCQCGFGCDAAMRMIAHQRYAHREPYIGVCHSCGDVGFPSNACELCGQDVYGRPEGVISEEETASEEKHSTRPSTGDEDDRPF